MGRLAAVGASVISRIMGFSWALALSGLCLRLINLKSNLCRSQPVRLVPQLTFCLLKREFPYCRAMLPEGSEISWIPAFFAGLVDI